jgi:diguanylate cyclase (GGDEF)-like protein/PAS domain S-box-containing protein
MSGGATARIGPLPGEQRMPDSKGDNRVVSIDRGRDAGPWRVARAAEEATARLDAMYRLIPSPLMDLEPSTLKVLRVNQRLRDLLGLPRDELAATTLFELIPAYDRTPLRAAVAAFNAGGRDPFVLRTAFGLEATPGAQDASRMAVTLSLQPVDGPGHRLLSILAVVTAGSTTAVDGQRLARACEIASVAVVERELHSGRFTRVNGPFCRLVGYTEAQLLSMNVEDLTPPEDLEAVRARIGRLVAGTVSEYTTMRPLLCANGSRCWVLNTITRLPGENGEPDRLITLYINVNEVVAARAALELSEARYRALVDTMPDGVQIVDASGAITFVNRAMVGLLGYPARHWLEGGQQAVTTALDAGGVERLRRLWAHYEAHGEFDDRPFETPWMRRDGRLLTIEQRAASLRNERGDVIGALVLLRDVTEERQSRLERERVAAIVEASEDAIFSVSRAHVVESWNAGCVRLFDLKPWLTVLRPLDSLFPRQCSAVLASLIDRTMAGEPVRNVDWPGSGTGRARWVVSMHAVRLRDGTVSSVAVMVRDVSAERTATQALEDERSFIRTVLDTLPLAVSVRDPLGRVLLANQRFDGLFHRDGLSTLGTSYADRLSDPADIEALLRADQEVLRTGKPVSYERRITLSAGQKADMHTIKVPIRVSGEMRILTASIDVSDRTRAQDDLRRERAFMRTVIDTDPTLISVKDAQGRFLLANRALAEALGLTVAQLEGQRLADVLPDAASHSGLATHDAEVLRLQRSVTHEECHRDATGAERWFSSTRLPLAGIDGAPVVLGVSTDITGVRQQARRIHELMNFDPLTGLPNRMLIEDRLQMALAAAERDAGRVAVMFVDLDHFKTVNDSLGHPVGDRLLVLVAKRLRSALRETDSIGRLGGDEFLLVLPQLDGPDAAARVARKLLKALEEPFDVQGHSLTVNASIGIGIYPEDGTTPHLLVQNADAAMYHAKEQGRADHRFFTRELSVRAARSLAIEHGIRRGLRDGEFELWYQPVHALADGAVVGMEALIRWRRANGELWAPGDFIGVAEERGLIGQLGRWVLEAACAFAAERHRAGLPAIPISVNLSPVQLRLPGLAALIDGTLRDAGIEPSLIELEVTESSLMHDIGAAIEVLQELRTLGVRIAVDDFGTGHSSMAWLRQLPIDKLKIDRAFVANLPANEVDTVIFRTIVSMARTLGIQTVAEGVETREQLDCVRSLGCDLVQGYLLAKPMAEADIGDWVDGAPETAGTEPAVLPPAQSVTKPGKPTTPPAG